MPDRPIRHIQCHSAGGEAPAPGAAHCLTIVQNHGITPFLRPQIKIAHIDNFAQLCQKTPVFVKILYLKSPLHSFEQAHFLCFARRVNFATWQTCQFVQSVILEDITDSSPPPQASAG